MGFAELHYAKILLEKAIPNGECLDCHFVPISAGYSYIRFDGQRLRAHRFVWQAFNHEIDRDTFVLHKCDNPRCINPKHLSIGTAYDNTQDMLAKGRHTYIHHNTRKVFPEMVTEMKKLRRQGVTLDQVAQQFNISPQTVFEYTSEGGRRYE